MQRRDQRGEGRLGFVITVAVFASLIFVGVKVLPVRISAYQFNDALREEARYASAHRDDDKIMERIIRSAESLNIPLDPSNVKIRRNKREVVIAASYEQPIDLKVTTYTYRFNEEQRAPVF